MPRIDFDALPDHGRLWVFPASRTLSPDEVRRTTDVVDAFLGEWAAHGVPLRSARQVRHAQFLLVGVDVDAEAPSGCSIDALVNRLRILGEELGVTFIDHSPIWFRDGETIRTTPRPAFRALAESDEVSLESVVFDTSLTTVSQLRDEELEKPVSDSWHARAFFRTAPNSAHGGNV
ncbi:MAG: hypothetical protein HKN72_17785 [Gemmatimonadetes bacterium]|nr:hypothetical protein [Gemmatimonadota bacterium]